MNKEEIGKSEFELMTNKEKVKTIIVIILQFILLLIMLIIGIAL